MCLNIFQSLALKLYTNSESVDSQQWKTVVNNANPFLSITFKKAFEESHQQNIRHLFYLLDNQVAGYAQEFHLNGKKIYAYQKRNLLVRGIVSIILYVLKIKVVGLGNGLLTNVENVISKNRHANNQFVVSLIEKISRERNISKFIIPDHFFSALGLENPKTAIPALIKVEVEEDMVLPIKPQWKRFNDYTQSLKKKYKVRQKGVIKKSQEIDIKLLSKVDLKAYEKTIQELFFNVQGKSSFGAVSFNTNIFQQLIELAVPKCKVYGYFLNEKMIGFSSEIEDNTNLYSYFIGLDYQYNKSHRLYERILMQSVKHAIELRKKKIVFGRTAAEFKSNIGAEPRQSFIYIYFKNPVLRRILKPFLQSIKPKKWVQRHPFKDN